MHSLLRRTLIALAAVALLATTAIAAAAPPAQAASSGVNDLACRPSAAHPEPVVLLHGLTANGTVNWFSIAPQLASQGYCVFTPTYGVRFGFLGGFAPIDDSIGEMAAYVDRVLEATGASQVSLVGHSEGTLVGTGIIQRPGYAAKVKHYVGIAGVYDGTSFFGINALARSFPTIADLILNGTCDACDDLLRPSAFQARLQADGITRPGPTYTNIVTRYDLIVSPYTSGTINEPGVTNITLQDRCKLDFSGHASVAVNPNVSRLVSWALGGKAGARPGCVPFFAPI